MNMAPQRKNFSKKVLSGGRLEIKWNGKNAKTTTLPVFIYHQSELTVNGKKINPKLNEIGMPIVQSKRGKNTRQFFHLRRQHGLRFYYTFQFLAG